MQELGVIEEQLVDSEIDRKHILYQTQSPQKHYNTTKEQHGIRSSSVSRLRAKKPKRASTQDESERGIRLHGHEAGENALEAFDIKDPTGNNENSHSHRENARHCDDLVFGSGIAGIRILVHAQLFLIKTTGW